MMRKCFSPRSYKQDLYLMLQSFKQNDFKFKQHLKAFERTYLGCDCNEEEKQEIAKFLYVLNPDCLNTLELQQYTNFDEVYNLVTKIGRQKDSKFQFIYRGFLFHI